MSKLTGGVATVHVGASTEVEMKEKIDRVDDAISATRAAMKMGVVPGGGTALLHIGRGIKSYVEQEKHQDWDDSYKKGWYCLCASTPSLLTTILSNTDMKEKAFEVVTKQVGAGDFKKGYNAVTNEVVDMFKEKILDPTAVTINVVENAVSVSCELITTDCVITNVRA